MAARVCRPAAGLADGVAAPKPNTDFWKDMGNIAMGIVWQTAGPDCLLIVYQCTHCLTVCS